MLWTLLVETGDNDGFLGGGEKSLGTGERALELGDIGRSVGWPCPFARCVLMIDSFDDAGPMGRRGRLELELVLEKGIDRRLPEAPTARPADGHASILR